MGHKTDRRLAHDDDDDDDYEYDDEDEILDHGRGRLGGVGRAPPVELRPRPVQLQHRVPVRERERGSSGGGSSPKSAQDCRAGFASLGGISNLQNDGGILSCASGYGGSCCSAVRRYL